MLWPMSVAVSMDFTETIFFKNNADTSFAKDPPILDLKFEHPAMLSSGETFAYVITMLKHPGYRPGGRIVQQWPKGFLPQPGETEFGKIEIDGNKLLIRWDKLPDHGIINISYLVEIKNASSGAYPVVTEYIDHTGLYISRTSGINVIGEIFKESEIPASEPTPTTFSLTAEYPLEVMQNSSFQMVFKIVKGKNVSSAELEIRLPPGFRPDEGFALPHRFNERSSQLVVSWDRMPASPLIEIPLNIYVEKPRHATYSFSAKFTTEGKTIATLLRHIMVVQQLNQKTTPEITVKDEQPQADTASLFDEIDYLLNEWIKATSTETDVQLQESDAIQTLPEVTATSDTVQNIIEAPKTEFRIQVFASATKTPELRERFLNMGITESLNEEYDGRTYRYTIGNFENIEKARSYRRILQEKGIKDAFIVKYVNGVRD
jgi:hypothetical protein